MEKKLYFKLSDHNGDVSKVVMSLDACMEWIKAEELEKVPEADLDDYLYTIQPVMLTEEEYENLPEADL